jgi:hypothetical protein
MARSSSEKLPRGTLIGYDDSAVPVEDEFANDDNAPIQSQEKKTVPNFPTESTVRTATVNNQPEIHSSKDPLPSQPDSSRERGTSPLADSTSASPAPGVSLLSHDFHVFTWLNLSTGSNLKRALKDLSKGGKSTIKGQKPETSVAEPEDGGDVPLVINDNHVKDDLGEIDQFLTHMTNLNQRLGYQGCTSQKRQDVYDFITKEKQELNKSRRRGLERRKSYENKVDLLNAADLMFQFFLPSNLDGPTVGKYWGALFRLIAVSINSSKEPLFNV